MDKKISTEAKKSNVEWNITLEEAIKNDKETTEKEWADLVCLTQNSTASPM